MEEEPEKQPYDPFRGSETVTLQELLEDVFSDNLEEGAGFAGPNALTVESQIWADEDRPLHAVARRGNVPCIKLLLDAGADPNSKGDLSCTPLDEAARSGHLEVARLLLEAGARIDPVNELGYSALGYCSPDSYKADPEMFRLLQSYWPGVLPEDVKTRK